MTKLQPVNNHLLIEPVEHKKFMASERTTYQEIGIVRAISRGINWKGDPAVEPNVSTGDKVYFDSWLAKKYPIEGSRDEFYWLVKWEDVTAVEYVDETSTMA